MQLFFAFTLLVSAVMLFVVEPMFAKMVLPLLGGAPAVWNTCMVFYQAALLGGYLYAHFGAKYLGPRRQAVVHLALMGLALVVLPLAVPPNAWIQKIVPFIEWAPPGDRNPIPWLLGVLSVSLGLPFLYISASAPMIQSWFSHTGHPAAKDPYFLYAASNLGSMIGLLGYPLVLESNLTLRQQSWSWSAGYVLLMLLTAGCAWSMWRSRRSAGEGDLFPADPLSGDDVRVAHAVPPPLTPPDRRLRPVTWGRRLRWLALALVPSSLLLGVTSYMSIDLAAFPLLWAIPLALYLLTFVMVFARRRLFSHTLMVHLQPPLIVLLAAVIFLIGRSGSQIAPMFVLSLLTFFVTALVCHGELANDRPATEHLTEFYLWMSVGGVLGGLFNALLAPVIFTEVLEFPLMIAAAALVRPGWRFGSSLEGAGQGESGLITVPRSRVALLGLVPAVLVVSSFGNLWTIGRLLWLVPPALFLGSLALAPFWRQALPRRGLIFTQITATALLALAWWLKNRQGPWTGIFPESLATTTLLAMELLTVFLTVLLCHNELHRDQRTSLRQVLLLTWPVLAVGFVCGFYFGVKATNKSMAADLTDLYGLVVQVNRHGASMLVFLLLAYALVRRNWQRFQWPARLLEWAVLLMVVAPVAVAVGARWPQEVGDYIQKHAAGVLGWFGQKAGNFGQTLQSARLSTLTEWARGALVFGAVAAFLLQRRAVMFGLATLAVLVVGHLAGENDFRPLHIERSFFGVLRVQKDAGYDSKYGAHKLLHGSTSHGMESCDPDNHEPWTYYHRNGPVGQIFSAIGYRLVAIGVVGLGTGTMAAYGQKYNYITFFEIDPAVERIARNKKYFHYLSDCQAKELKIVLGDARLKLAKYPTDFDILLIDAFSSDAIPAHLLTKEAIDVYFSKLAPTGVLAVHISNRHLDLRPVLGNLAKAGNLAARICEDDEDNDKDEGDQREDDTGRFSSTWIILARHDLDLGSLAASTNWKPLPPDENQRLWTDDFSNVLDVLNWKPKWKWFDPRNWIN